jgi:hypothetical protein
LDCTPKLDGSTAWLHMLGYTCLARRVYNILTHPGDAY